MDTPARARAKADVWRPKFLDALRETANVTLSAKAAGVGRQTAYEARNRSKLFAKQWDDALDEAVDLLAAEARRRAYSGVPEPVYWHGEVVGSIQRYSDQLLMFLLRAHRPDMYRENYRIEQSGEMVLRWEEDQKAAAESARKKIAEMVKRLDEEDAQDNTMQIDAPTCL